MLTYRTFRNTDPPRLSALWKTHVGRLGLPSHVTTDLLEQLVFAKLYFDYAGLLLAFDDDQLVGFAHGGFGPNEARDAIDTSTGVISLVLTRPGDGTAAAVGLVERCEAYLRGRGAQRLRGGGVFPNCPFYAGMYGLSEPAGVLEDDAVFRDALLACGFQPAGQTITYERELLSFEAPIDRRQMEIRRRMVAQVTLDAPTRSWWEACLWSEFDLTRIELAPRGSSTAAAWAVFRNIEPLGSSGARRAAGLIDVSVDEAYRRRGLAVFLMSEACREFARQGVVRLFAQVPADNTATHGLLGKIGMKPALRGTVFEKG